MDAHQPGRESIFAPLFVTATTAVISLFLLTQPLAAQQSFVTGTVSSETGQPLIGATVNVPNSPYGTLTNSGGAFRLGPLPAGSYNIRISAIGYRDISEQVTLAMGETETLTLQLVARPVELSGVNVSVLRADLQPESSLDDSEVRQSNPRDVGEALRVLPGIDAVRRGPVGLDPVVRGLRETEVGVYLDGTRQFPAGPARMDSPLTHLDPSALERVEVVKGPYALTWGAGNMSAIRVETQPIPPLVPGIVRGRAIAGYDSNLAAVEGAASIFGSTERFGYWLHGAWREGDDYQGGNGVSVPADFLSREVRGKVGYQLAPGSWLSVAGGIQAQDDIDYPGRLLDADYFDASNLAATWEMTPASGVLQSLEAKAYWNRTDHAMDNDEKPTAQPMEGRVPPFALDVDVDSRVTVLGGRLATTLAPRMGLELELGGDVYSANRDAIRTIARRDNGMVMFEDLMWPDATITDAGVFARAAQSVGNGSLTGTLRVDQVWVNADTLGSFFAENVSTVTETEETNFNAAVVGRLPLSPNWSFSIGAGSAVRTADASERFADRIPASKAQTSAEFVGNPELEPERSNQADVWLDGSYSTATVQLNGFYRQVDNYITLAPTSLPKRLPLSPNTVFQYVNGDAEFYGGEASLLLALNEMLSVGAGGSYLYGQDTSLDEPALGVTPLTGRFQVRVQPTETFYVEGNATAVAEQDRISVTRNELMTPGYTVFDLEAGIEVGQGAQIRVGLNNVTDKQYVNHLNARNPFTTNPIPEPGRVLFARLNYAF